MPKLNTSDIYRGITGALLSLICWLAIGITTEQGEIKRRVQAVEWNQIKTMTVLGIDPTRQLSQASTPSNPSNVEPVASVECVEYVPTKAAFVR